MKTLKIKNVELLRDRSGKVRVPTKVMGKPQKGGWLAIIGVAMLAGIGFTAGPEIYEWGKAKGAAALSSVGVIDADVAANIAADGDASEPVSTVVVDTRDGVAATAYFNAFDKAANSKTEIYPSWWVFDQNDATLLNGVAANSTSTVRGYTLQAFIGGSTYYGAPPGDLVVSNEAPTFDIDAWTIATETNLATKAYDSDQNVLTADDNATNTADYAIDMNADDADVIYVKLSNDQANSRYQVGAFCTFEKLNSSSIDSFEITDGGWEEIDVPKELDDATITYTNDAGTAYTQTGYDLCYRPSATDSFGRHVIILDENEETPMIKGLVDTSATAPTANRGNVVGGLFIDAAYEDAKSGEVIFDIFKHDDNEQVTAVGISDTTTSPQGLTSGVMIEVQ